MFGTKLAALAAAVAIGFSGIAHTQEQYPNRLITIVAPVFILAWSSLLAFYEPPSLSALADLSFGQYRAALRDRAMRHIGKLFSITREGRRQGLLKQSGMTVVRALFEKLKRQGFAGNLSIEYE